MNEFRKSTDNRGVTIRKSNRASEKEILDSMNPKPIEARTLGFGADTKTYIEFVDITPEWAKKALEKNFNNRHPKTPKIREYAYQMSTNQFPLTGDTTKFNKRGELIDGQHRLYAIISSGVTLRMAVAYNVDDYARTFLDKGRHRTLGDEFSMAGFKNGTRLAAAIRMYYFIKTGKQSNMLTFEDCREIYEGNKETFTWMENAFAGKTIYDNAVIAAALAVAYPNNPEAINNFAEKLHTGHDLKKGSPIAALREAIINVNSKKKNRSTFSDLYGRYRFSLKVLRAAHMYLNNEVIKSSGNLYSTPIGLRYFAPTAQLPSFMINENNND